MKHPLLASMCGAYFLWFVRLVWIAPNGQMSSDLIWALYYLGLSIVLAMLCTTDRSRS